MTLCSSTHLICLYWALLVMLSNVLLPDQFNVNFNKIVTNHISVLLLTQSNAEANKLIRWKKKIVAVPKVIMAPLRRFSLCLFHTWVLLPQLREVGVAVEHRSNSCHFAKNFFLLPLKHPSLSCWHHVLLTLSCWWLIGWSSHHVRTCRWGRWDSQCPVG